MTRLPCGSTAAPEGVSPEPLPKSKLAISFPCGSVLIARICGLPDGSNTVAMMKKLPEASTASRSAEPDAPIATYRATNWFDAAVMLAATKMKRSRARTELMRIAPGFGLLVKDYGRWPDAGTSRYITIPQVA